MKKILFVFRDMGTGGAQKIEAFVANALVEDGYEVVVINMASTPCTVDINKEVRIYDVLYDKAEKCPNRIMKVLYKILYLFQLRKQILALKPDLICGFLSDVVRIIVLAMTGCNIPIIGSERGDPYTFTDRQFMNYKNAYKKCRGVVFQLEDVKALYNLPSHVIQNVIPNPCVPRLGNRFCTSSNSAKVIISAGRLAEQKRFDLLIDAFEIVYQKRPDYCLHIYGNGPLYQELKMKVEASVAKDNISLKGDVKDVFTDELKAEMFVLTSDFEGIPNVLIEAMAAGIPCISTDCSPGGARFLLKGGKCGLLVPRNNKEKLAEAIEQYIGSEDLRRSMREKALKTIQEYDPKEIKKMWLEIFENCL